MKKFFAILLFLLILCSVCTVLAEYTDSETILAVQTALHDSGIYKGNLSGIKGNATEAAIRTYQQKNGLNVSGQIDDELLVSLGLSDGAKAAGDSSDTKPAQSNALSFSVITNKDYGNELLVFQNEAITIYLDRVSFSQTNNFGPDMMTVSFACDMNDDYFPKTSGYAAKGNLTVLKVGGVSTKTAYHLSDGLRDYYGMGQYLQYPFQNPGKQGVDIEIELKSGNNNPKKFTYKIGPIHIDIAGDIYDGIESQYAEHTAESVSLGGLLRYEPVLLSDTNGVTITATSIQYQGRSSYTSEMQILLNLRVSNANSHDVVLYIPWEGVHLNGNEYDGTMLVRTPNTWMDSTSATIPALSDNLTILLYIHSDDGVVPTLEELNNGQIELTAYMAPNDEIASEAYYRWPELFVLDPLSFDMAYDGEPVPEPVTLSFPSLSHMTGTNLFSYDGITLFCEDSYSYPASGGSWILNGTCVLQNDTDYDLSISLEEPLLNDEPSSARLLLVDESGNSLSSCPAHGHCKASFLLLLPEGIHEDTVSSIKCTLHYLNTATLKNYLWQPVVFEISDTSDTAASETPLR